MVAGLATLCGAAGAQSPRTVRFASVNALSDAGVFLADDLGYFARLGIACAYEVIGSAPGLITAAITNAVDVAGVAITPGLFAATQRGIALKIVGDKQSIRPGFSNTRLVVRPSAFDGDRSGSIARLRGKSLGVTSRGSTGFYLMAKTLAKHGVGLDDVRIVEMEYANIIAAMSNGAIEGGMLLDPYLTKAISGGIAVEISDCADVAPGGDPSIVAIVYSEQFGADQAVAQNWMLAYMQGVRAYNDAFVKNIDRARVINILAAHTHLEPALIEKSFPVGLDPDQRINLAALADFQKFYMELGLLRQGGDVASIVDTSFARHALAELGPYSAG